MTVDASSPLRCVEDLIRVLEDLANENAGNGDKPYRGLLAGVELALLDLVGKSFDLPIHQLLGTHRAAPPNQTPLTWGDENTLAAAIKASAKDAPITRIQGSGELSRDLGLLDLCMNIHSGLRDGHRAIWFDALGSYDQDVSIRFVSEVVDRVKQAELSSDVIVQNLIDNQDDEHLISLQRQADQYLSPASCGDTGGVRIMVDINHWDARKLNELLQNGGCRAITVDPTLTGGFLPVVRLVQKAVEADADIFVHLSGGSVSSEVSLLGLKHLSRAIVKIDALSHPELPDETIQLKYRSVSDRNPAGSVTDLDEPGLGAVPSYADAVPHAQRFFWAPEPESIASVTGEAPNLFDVRLYDRMTTDELDSQLIQREALAHGLDIERTSTIDFVGTDRNGRTLHFSWSTPPDTHAVARALTTNKQTTRMLLQRNGVPVPDGRSFLPEDQEAAYDYALTLGYPVVLKPVDGTGGRGVFADLRNPEDLRWAFERLSEVSAGPGVFIIEKHVHGDDYRLFVMGSRVLSVAQRTPAAVVGDGIRTVMELVVEKNSLRLQNPHLLSHRVRVGPIADHELERQGLSLSSVPERGQRVTLAAVANLAQGGDSIGLLEEVHPSILEAAVEAVAAVPGLALGGVDFLLADHRLPLDEQDAGICEINSSPAQTANETTLYGYSAPISRELITHFGARYGLQLRTVPLELVTLRVRVIGNVEGAGYLRHVDRLAERLELDGWARVGEPRAVDLCVSGNVGHVSTLLSLLVRPRRRALPERVHAAHTAESVRKGFEIVS